MDAASATTALERMVAHDQDPTLDEFEVADLLESAKRPDSNGNLPTNVDGAAAWAASTTYAPGDVITADPAAGRWWVCLVGGTSDSTQPTWPDLDGYVRTSQRIDDNTVTWVDAGAAWVPTWDLAAAAVEGWELKAGKAAGRYMFQTDGQTFSRQQVISNCHAQADRLRRRKRSVSVEGE